MERILNRLSEQANLFEIAQVDFKTSQTFRKDLKSAKVRIRLPTRGKSETSTNTELMNCITCPPLIQAGSPTGYLGLHLPSRIVVHRVERDSMEYDQFGIDGLRIEESFA